MNARLSDALHKILSLSDSVDSSPYRCLTAEIPALEDTRQNIKEEIDTTVSKTMRNNYLKFQIIFEGNSFHVETNGCNVQKTITQRPARVRIHISPFQMLDATKLKDRAQ